MKEITAPSPHRGYSEEAMLEEAISKYTKKVQEDPPCAIKDEYRRLVVWLKELRDLRRSPAATTTITYVEPLSGSEEVHHVPYFSVNSSKFHLCVVCSGSGRVQPGFYGDGDSTAPKTVCQTCLGTGTLWR